MRKCTVRAISSLRLHDGSQVKIHQRYKVGCDLPGKYRVALDSDAWEFGGPGRVLLRQVGHKVDRFTTPEGIPGVRETKFNNHPNSFKVLSPPRKCVVDYIVEESSNENDASTIFNEAADIGETLHDNTNSTKDEVEQRGSTGYKKFGRWRSYFD